MRSDLHAIEMMRPIPTMLLLLALVFSAALSTTARADDAVVLAIFPAERREEMTAALRLELAGRATLVEAAALDGSETTRDIRAIAEAHGATHVVWIVFPSGLLAPAEVRVLDLARSAPAHATTPEAWDVVDARVVAVLASSVMDAAPAEPAVVEGPVIASVVVPETPEAAAPSEPAAAPAAPAIVAARDPRAARRFSLMLGPSFTYITSPGAPVALGAATDLAFYARLSEWASIGMRLRFGGVGYSSLSGVLVSGALGVPSILVSFREPLGTAAMIELGVHVEGGLFFYGNNASEWSFGLGGGGSATIELGASQGIQLDYTIDLYGFGTAGSYGWGALTLGYVARFE